MKHLWVCSIGAFVACLVLFVTVAVQGANAQTPLPRFDFTQTVTAGEWKAQHDIDHIAPTGEGLQIVLNGPDPYVVGPARDYPANALLWLRVRLKSEQSGNGQVFYFPATGGPDEAHSVRFPVRAGKWEELRVPLPALGPNFRLRFDPPGIGGTCLLAFLGFEPRVMFQPPVWPRSLPPALGSDTLTIQSGVLSLVQAHHQAGGFIVKVGDQTLAVGYTRPLLGYLPPNAKQDDKYGGVRWVDVSHLGTATATKDGEEILVRATLRDPDGATWYLHRSFRPSPPGSIHVLTTIQTDKDRDVLFLPMFLLLAGQEEGKAEDGRRKTEENAIPASGRPPTQSEGHGSPEGHNRQSSIDDQPSTIVNQPATSNQQPATISSPFQKSQALFAGLEYLDREEPSSSEADIRGPGAQRQTPDSAKITFPLMAISNGANYVGLIWDKPEEFTALFDSPDRVLGTGKHVMGVLWPGSDGSNRQEGSLLPYEPQRLKANKPLVMHATIIGGHGRDITPAVQQYVALHPLPPLPKPGLKWQDYVRLAAAGFLDSGIYDQDRYRHAYPNFGSQPAADVALYLEWLATQTGDRALQTRLYAWSKGARALVPDNDLNTAAIGHVHYPAPALLYGHVEENVRRMQQNGQELLSRFDGNNIVPYQPPATGANLGSTHFAPDANGLTAQVVAEILQAAVCSGDGKLLASGLEKLHTLDRFAGTAPRGAQTWEVPLHTPDILASAYLVRAYTLGYEITGDRRLLDQAKYWAWTGVPFVYLVNPTEQAIGLYATIAVYGATQWVAPNWMGLPVQWCGLVYADALYRFLKYDPTGPWKQLADGITASGIQQTYPRTLDPQRQGLLPDSFTLRAQLRNDPAINPGTLLTEALRYYERPTLYDFQAFRSLGVFVHAPCEIDSARENGQPIKDVPDSNILKANNLKPASLRNVGFDNKDNGVGQKFSFVVHGWTIEPYYVLISGLKTTPAVRINRQEVPLSAPNQFTAATGRLILQVRGTAQIEVGSR